MQKSKEEFVVVELGINTQVETIEEITKYHNVGEYFAKSLKPPVEKQGSMDIIAKKMIHNENMKLIRIPYYDPKTFFE